MTSSRLIAPLLLLLSIAAGAAEPGDAAAPPAETWTLHGQLTWIQQHLPGFSAAYTLPGFKSLPTDPANSRSGSATLFGGFRPWAGGEIYGDAEMVMGVPFADLTGLAAVPNTELQKASGPRPLYYIPRVFLRQTWGFGGGEEEIEDGNNQLAETVDEHRLVLTVGKVSIGDIFDANRYAHDGRRDFMNWVAVTHGAYDYAADVRGYTIGAAVEYYDDDWVVRVGRFMVPRESNGLQLNFSIMNFHGDQIEIEHDHEIGGRRGSLKLLAFANRALMGRFDDALAFWNANGRPAPGPDVAPVRKPNIKRGIGVNLEQELTDDLGLFARLASNDGATEMFSYTEVERSALVGLSLRGAAWGRPADTIGVAIAEDGLSQSHRDYLAAGGTGFLIGDGRLNYRPERLFESYYSFAVARNTWLSIDYQHIANPAYNADRGPVNIYGLRLHAEF